MSGDATLHLFEAVGIEIEYMIADRATLDVRPIADRLIASEAGHAASELERAEMAWSNELALHVIEFKTNGPAASLHDLGKRFQGEVTHANRLLAPLGARLMPTGMHPWMDPHEEFLVWPHEHGPVYEAFDRIFDCRGHGWANLQSMHVNLPFCGDEEFGRLHAAIRVALPLLPALAASSPLADGRLAGALDARLVCYANNARRVPSVAGDVIPEPVFTRVEYEREILGRIYRDLAPLDPEGVLRHEWANARGAIARFDRNAIEIRLLDVQECPAADLAIAAAVWGLVLMLVQVSPAEAKAQRDFPGDRLVALLRGSIAQGDQLIIEDPAYLELLGWRGPACSARELWIQLVARIGETEPGFDEWRDALSVVLEDGCLARRIRSRLAGDLRRERVAEVYLELCECLATGALFRARG